MFKRITLFVSAIVTLNLFILSSPLLYGQGTNGLVAWWTFEEGSGTITYDMSGNGHNGTLQGATWNSGGGVKLENLHDAIEFENTPFQLAEGSWDIVINIDQYLYGAIVTKDNNGYQDDAVLWLMSNGTLNVSFDDASGSTVHVSSSETIQLNQDVRVTVEWGSLGMKLFINGILVGDNPHTGGVISTQRPLTIGYNGTWSNDRSFSGVVKDFKVYNKYIFENIDGLVAYYPLNGDANDMSGNENNGTLIGGVTYAIDRFGLPDKAIQLDGTNGYVEVPNSTSLQSPTNGITLAGWIYLENYTDWGIVMKSGSSESYGEYGLDFQSSYPGHWFWINESDGFLSPAQLNLSTWYFISATKDGNTAKVYLDGEIIGSYTFSGAILPDENPVTIGCHFPGSPDNQVGRLDDIRIYNRALTQSEILDLYHQDGWPLNQGLVAHYPLGNDLNDYSGNNNSGLPIGTEPIKINDRFDRPDSARLFSSTTQNFVQIQNSFTLDEFQEITISAWVKSLGATYDNQTIVGKWNGDVSNQAWTLDLAYNSTHPQIGIQRSNGEIVSLISNKSIAINEWTHIVGMYDGTNLSLYISGELDTLLTLSSQHPIISASTTATIGAHDESITSDINRFNGGIDDIRIFNRALTQAEISDLYHENGWGGEKTPVIFIPGIMGSALYNDVNDDGHLEDDERLWIQPIQVWPPIFPDTDALRLAEDGTSPFNPLYNIKVSPIRGDNTRTIRDELDSGILKNKPLNVYRDLVQFLESDENGYKLDDDATTSASKNLFIFTYDWRKSINYNSSLLSEYIQNVRNWTNSQQVNLICHSMGGLIAKELISNLGNNTSIIRKIIFVGTPHLGSPKALYVTLSGDPLFPITIYTTTQILRASRNFPSGYSLFPSESYYDLNIDNGHSANVNSYSYTFQKKDEQPMSYTSIKTFFKDVTVHHSLGQDYTFNDDLIDLAYITHQNLEITNFGDIEVYNIVAYNNPTIGKVTFNDNSFNYSKTYALANVSGDGTVPLRSAELINNSLNTADTTYYITNRWQPIPFNWNTADHGALLGNAAVLEVIGGLLLEPTYTGPFNNPDIAQNYPSNYGVEWYKQVTVGSPIEVHAYDYDGNHTGPTSDSTWEARIPNSNYLISSINDPKSSKGLILSGDTPVVIKVISRDTTSSFDLILNEILDGNNNFEVIFDSVIITPTTVATCSLEIVNSELNLLVDYDGDGNTDTTLTPTYVTSAGEESIHQIPKRFSLNQNYPNPFNPSTKISYSLPNTSMVQLKVFNILGQEIATLVNEEKPAGNYNIDFNASTLTSGVYLYRIQAGNYIQTKKMILMK